MTKPLFRCPKCGSTRFRATADLKDNDPMTCLSCGHATTLAKVKAAGLEEAKKMATDAITKAFRKR